MTRLMALKFFKSLLHLSFKHKEILHVLIRLNPLEKCWPLVGFCKERSRNLNILHSAMFEFINSYGQAVYEVIGEELHTQIVEANAKEFEWCPGLVDKFFMPDAKAKKIARDKQASKLGSLVTQSQKARQQTKLPMNVLLQTKPCLTFLNLIEREFPDR